MSLQGAIVTAYRVAKARDWNRIYVLLDIHGTVAGSTHKKHSPDEEISFYKNAIKALKVISRFKEVWLVMWTSSYPDACKKIRSELKKRGVNIRSINTSPVKNCGHGDFSKKPYCSLIIDDKAGFDLLEWDTLPSIFRSVRKTYKLRK